MHTRYILAVLSLVGVLAISSCNPGGSTSDDQPGEPSAADPSVIVNRSRAPSPEVENGTAYDRADVDLGGAKKLVLPHTTTVRRAGKAGDVQLFIAKTLSFVGHPPEPMTIQGARKNMGCAVRVEGEALVVATYGEWDSRIEGGASMKLVAVVPDGLEVEQRKGLSGPGSAGQDQDLTRPKSAPAGYWYGPASPAEGWTAVPTIPDPERTGSESGYGDPLIP